MGQGSTLFLPSCVAAYIIAIIPKLRVLKSLRVVWRRVGYYFSVMLQLFACLVILTAIFHLTFLNIDLMSVSTHPLLCFPKQLNSHR